MLSFTGAIAIQQDSVPAHHARQTTELLQRETTKFIGLDLWTPNSPDLHPANYNHIRRVMQVMCIRHQFKMWPIWDNAWLTHGVASYKALWMMPLTNGQRDFELEWMKREAILDTCCNTRTG